MARLLAHPFRLDVTGSAVTVEDGSDDSDVQAIVVLVCTRQGERPLVPTFGVPDPVYGELDTADVAAGLAAFGPPLTVVGVDRTPITDTVEELTVTYRDDTANADPEIEE